MNKHVPRDPESEAERERKKREARRDIELLIRWAFPIDEHKRAIRTAWAVSGFNTLACDTFGKGSVGLFALFPFEAGLLDNEGWQLLNPVRNVAAAHAVWQRRGWARWPIGPDKEVRDVFNQDPEG